MFTTSVGSKEDWEKASSPVQDLSAFARPAQSIHLKLVVQIPYDCSYPLCTMSFPFCLS